MNKLIDLAIKYAEENGYDLEETFVRVGMDGTGLVEFEGETVFYFEDEEDLKKMMEE